MTADEVAELLRLAADRGLLSFEVEADGAMLRLVFEEQSAPDAVSGGELPETALATQAPPPVASRGLPGGKAADAVLSPGVGLFRRAHPAGGAPMPGESQAVAAGAVVGFVQAGPLLQPVVAPRAGTLGALLVAEGAGVGFGTPLFGLA